VCCKFGLKAIVVKGEGMRTKCCPNRRPFQYAFPHGGGESDATGSSVLVDCNDVVIVVVQNASVDDK
jgi:hypothetical protein